jgi:hypothetical protein
MRPVATGGISFATVKVGSRDRLSRSRVGAALLGGAGRRQDAAAYLVVFDRLEQCLEVALAEAVVAVLESIVAALHPAH